MVDLDAIEKEAAAFLARWGKSSRVGHAMRDELERSAQDIALVEAVRAAQRETASLRHAALLAAGIHGGPGAWRWARDPAGTILDDVAAWERLLEGMRDATAYREKCQAALDRGECPGCGFAPCLCDQQ